MNFRPLRRPQGWFLLWLLAIAAVVVLCLLPLPPIGAPDLPADKLGHVLGYAALAAYAGVLFTRAGLARAVLALFAVGIAVEALQTLLPWRSGELLDILANTLGLVLGATVAWTPAAGLLVTIERMLLRRHEP